jgi:hypothetical protein
MILPLRRRGYRTYRVVHRRPHRHRWDCTEIDTETGIETGTEIWDTDPESEALCICRHGGCSLVILYHVILSSLPLAGVV